MPRGGHSAKPTKLKLIQGTFRPDRAPSKEITPPPVKKIDPPRELDVHAKRYWRTYGPMLRRLGLLTEADLPAFTALCGAWSMHQRAGARLRTVFRSKAALTPERLDFIRKAEVSIERANHTLRQLWSEFGMTPAARSRLDVYAPPPTEEDDFERFMSGGAS
jgi:P27 family predicted phage terminase small subunit